MLQNTVIAIGWMTTTYFVFKFLYFGWSVLFRKKDKDRSWYEKPIFENLK